jgi:hypothetical protein
VIKPDVLEAYLDAQVRCGTKEDDEVSIAAEKKKEIHFKDV